MITKYASAIQDYDKLFDKANARLTELGVTDAKIGDLQSYFSHLRDLVYGPNDVLNTGKPEDIIKIEAGYEFLKLPLDEPHLIINANQRTINTKPFTDAGGVLSVQGDEISEIVFFEVDRYFDSTDLSQMQIAIQWKNKQDEGSTPAFIRIVQATKDNLDEKLIFGWPITSEVTKVAGAVQFSVRFYDRAVDSEEFNYSLVTLPATLNIGASLSAVLDEDSMDDPRPTILSRLSNSRILGGSEYAIAPIFVYPYREGMNTDPIQVDFGQDKSYLLQAMARKDGSKGSVTYKWYKSPLDEDNWEGLDTQNDPNDLWKPGLEEDNSYILVTSWHDDFEELSTFYYQKEENGKIIYKTCSPIASKDGFESNLKAHNNKLYIRGTSLQLNLSPDTSVLGKYCVDSRVGFVGTYAYASGANPLDDGEFLGTTNLDNLPMWIVKGPEVVKLNPLNHHYDLRQKTLDNEVEAVLSGENLDNTTSYSWYYSPSSREEDFQLLDGENDSTLTINNEGYYYAVATNYKNGESNYSETPVTVAYNGIKGYSKDKTQIQKLGDNQFKIIVNNDEAGIEESLSYHWIAFGQSAALGSIKEIDTTEEICTFSEDVEIFYIQVIVTIEKGKTETNEAFEVSSFVSDLVSLEDMV